MGTGRITEHASALGELLIKFIEPKHHLQTHEL